MSHNFAHRYSCAVKEINEVTNMRFDVTIGNPPYQHPLAGENDSKNAQGSFWWKFTEQAMEYSDTVAMVTPLSIFSVGGFGSSTNKVTKVEREWVQLHSYLERRRRSLRCWDSYFCVRY